jgi:hypothetical protein
VRSRIRWPHGERAENGQHVKWLHGDQHSLKGRRSKSLNRREGTYLTHIAGSNIAEAPVVASVV